MKYNYFTFITGLVLIDQTEKNKTTMIKENEVSTIFCKFECPLDVLQPVTIKWIENYSFELEGQHYEHIDSDKRQTIGNLTLTSAVQKAAMLRSEQTPDLQSISLVYQCVGIIGNRTDEAVTSEPNKIEIQCKQQMLVTTDNDNSVA